VINADKKIGELLMRFKEFLLPSWLGVNMSRGKEEVPVK
jgi:hypothetical protein